MQCGSTTYEWTGFMKHKHFISKFKVFLTKWQGMFDVTLWWFWKPNYEVMKTLMFSFTYDLLMFHDSASNSCVGGGATLHLHYIYAIRQTPLSKVTYIFVSFATSTWQIGLFLWFLRDRNQKQPKSLCLETIYPGEHWKNFLFLEETIL